MLGQGKGQRFRDIAISPGHKLRGYTPAMMRSKGAAMPQNLSYLSSNYRTVFSIMIEIQ